MKSRALVKIPSSRFACGLTTKSLGRPDPRQVAVQHRFYVEALQRTGLEVLVLEPDEHPDSCFVEDLALILDSRVVLTRPRHPARAAEQQAIRDALAEALPNFPLVEIEAPGYLEGGDVLRMGDRWFVGCSHRTNDQGFEQLAAILLEDGQRCFQVKVPDVLHLKTGVTAVGRDTVLALPPLVESFRKFGLRVVEVSEAESHAVNVVAVGSRIVMPSGYPGVRQAVAALGLEPQEVELSEFQKQDGGATCLSILLP